MYGLARYEVARYLTAVAGVDAKGNSIDRHSINLPLHLLATSTHIPNASILILLVELAIDAAWMGD